MKKFLFTLMLLITTLATYAVNYEDTKNFVRYYGYTIEPRNEWFATATQGNFIYFYKTFYAGTTYKVVGLSEDNDVKDVDIYLYNPDGSEAIKDSDSSNLAVVDFTPNYTVTLKVVVKNYNSLTPTYASTIRAFIAYK